MGDISIKGSNKSILRGPHGFGPKPFLNKPGQAQGTHGGKAKGGRIGLPSKRKDFKTHGRDVPTMAAKGGRIGLQYGGPPNRGRTNLLEQLGRVEAERSNPNRRAEISRVHGELNRGYAVGGVVKSIIKGGKKISKKISDAARKKDTADRIKIFEQAGPHEGAVITKRILGEGTKKGDRTKAAVKDAMEAKPWAGKPHAEGGRIGRAAGGWTKVIPRTLKKLDFPGDRTGKPHSSREGRRDSWVRGARRAAESAKKIKEKMKPKRPSPQPLAKGGRIGLKHGTKPWGTGPKPGTHEFLMQQLHKRKGKAKGGRAGYALGSMAGKVGRILASKLKKKKKVYPETEDLTHQKGPYVGDVGSEGKRRKAGPREKGKFPGRPKAPGPKGRRPWRDAIPGRPRPGTPAPNWIKPKKYQEAAEGGRIEFRKGGTDKKWMQKVSASIKKRGTKGKCTPITKPGCTGRAKALAKTFKKIAAKRKA